ncbi:hypothetical protein YA0032_06050 [Pseudomonas amygdali]|uniref:hypothetical protein n=1 Tax=Pseudomonas amygdali TaxID=47877 RepID=UPI0018E5F638|nr:hypothetical protein [Pseudomonas amygdali]MBI6727711.1 hypothetical protein [Pseudomonas amygdali]MBI6810750.1 hypothetical protein [Pseudomonas amygdali]
MTTKVTITHSQDHYPSKVDVSVMGGQGSADESAKTLIASLEHGQSIDVHLHAGQCVVLAERLAEA